MVRLIVIETEHIAKKQRQILMTTTYIQNLIADVSARHPVKKIPLTKISTSEITQPPHTMSLSQLPPMSLSQLQYIQHITPQTPYISQILLDVQKCSQRFYNFKKKSKGDRNGRKNSQEDEKNIIQFLIDHFGDKIYVFEGDRSWCDILVRDDENNCWHPVNIKTTEIKTSDNAGNYAMLVHALTDHELDLRAPNCNGGAMLDILDAKIHACAFNMSPIKDYYYLVFNKNQPGDVILNSIRGLSELTCNASNMPFQISWKKNRTCVPKSTFESVTQVKTCFAKTAESVGQRAIQMAKKWNV